MPVHFRFPVLVAAALMVPALAAAQTNVYRWVDKDGKVHFSDTPPPEPAKSVTQKRMGGVSPSDAAQLPYATQVAMKKSPVTIYTAAECGDSCKQGRDLLLNRGIPFNERDVQASGGEAEVLKKLVGGLFVPVLTVGANTLKGYSEGQWQGALDSAGYPRTVLPGQQRPRPPVQPAPPSPAAPAEPPPVAEPAEAQPATEREPVSPPPSPQPPAPPQ